MASVRRVKLELRPSELEALRNATDKALNLTGAQLAQAMLDDRQLAVETLKGEPVATHVVATPLIHLGSRKTSPRNRPPRMQSVLTLPERTATRSMQPPTGAVRLALETMARVVL